MANQTEPIVSPPKQVYDHTYTFRLRRIKGGSFNNLWELARLNKMGHVIKIIDDANQLNFCMENLIGELESDGF